MRKRCIIVAGPRGAGKSTLVSALVAQIPHLHRALSHTTREPRPGEEDGIDYHFIDSERFNCRIQRNAFLFYRTLGPLQKSGISRTELLDHGDSILDITGPVARELRDALVSREICTVFSMYMYAPRELRLGRILRRDSRLSVAEAMRLIEADPDSGDHRLYRDFDRCIENAPPRADMKAIVDSLMPSLMQFVTS